MTPAMCSMQNRSFYQGDKPALLRAIAPYSQDMEYSRKSLVVMPRGNDTTT